MSINYRREQLRQGKTLTTQKLSSISVKTSNTDVEKLKEKIDELQKKLSAMKQEIELDETFMMKTSERVNNLEIKTKEIKSCECDTEKIKTEIEDLKESLKTESIVSDSLCNEMDELKETFDPSELNLIKTSLTSSISDLSSLKSLVQGNKTQCSSDFAKLRSEINSLKKEIENIKKKLK